ncbi:MAG: circularly permuted type 2 ATP-grasp protein, partial [Chloroflexota bacterium]
MEGLFAGYEPQGYCEVITPDGPRSHYAGLVERLGALSADDMAARAALVESILRRQGITFAVYGEKSGTERTWPLDLVPRLIPAAEWDHLERGLTQRVTAL